MAKHKIKEFEIRTIDQYGDAIDIVWTAPIKGTKFDDVVAMLPTFIDEDAVAVVVEEVTHISTDDRGVTGKIAKEHLANEDLEYSPTLAWFGDEEALREGGWI